jgi:lysophospholipase L1-like esterase
MPVGEPTLSRQKRILFSIVMLGVSLVLTLTLMELLVRLFRPQPTYSALLSWLEGERYVPGGFIPFTLAPSYVLRGPSHEFPGAQVTVSTNRWGLRGEEISLEKPRGTKRILVLGDSYTFGLYVNDGEAYPAVLQSMLRADGYRVEVLNAGYADGWSPDEHYAWLLRRGLAFEPDIIVYGFFIGNDLDDIDESHWRELDRRGLPTRIENPDIYVDATGRIRSHVGGANVAATESVYRVPILRESHLAVYLARVASRYLPMLRRRGVPPGARPTNLLRTDPANHHWGADPFPFILREGAGDPWIASREQLFIRLVEGMASVAREKDAKFLLLMIPINFQVEPRFLETVVGSSRFAVARDYFAELAPVLDGKAIPHQDLLDAMRRQPGRYFPADGEVHFNPAGHRFAAAKLREAILSRGWLATPSGARPEVPEQRRRVSQLAREIAFEPEAGGAKPVASNLVRELVHDR